MKIFAVGLSVMVLFAVVAIPASGSTEPAPYLEVLNRGEPVDFPTEAGAWIFEYVQGIRDSCEEYDVGMLDLLGAPPGALDLTLKIFDDCEEYADKVEASLKSLVLTTTPPDRDAIVVRSDASSRWEASVTLAEPLRASFVDEENGAKCAYELGGTLKGVWPSELSKGLKATAEVLATAKRSSTSNTHCPASESVELEVGLGPRGEEFEVEFVEPKAPSVETKPAEKVAPTEATLAGAVNPNGANVSVCKFEYGTSTAYGKSASCAKLPGAGASTVAVSAAIRSLAKNITYDYRIVATNTVGTTKGGNRSFKT